MKIALSFWFVTLVLCNYEAGGNEIADTERVRAAVGSSLRTLESLNAEIGKPLGMTLLRAILKEEEETKMRSRFNGVLKMLFTVGTKNFRSHIKTFNETVQKITTSQLRKILQSFHEGQLTPNKKRNENFKNETQREEEEKEEDVKGDEKEEEVKGDEKEEVLNNEVVMNKISLLQLIQGSKWINQL